MYERIFEFSSTWLDPAVRPAVRCVTWFYNRLSAPQFAAMAILYLAILLWLFWNNIWSFVSPASWNIEGYFKNPNDIAHLRNLTLFLLGLIGLPLAIWRSTVAQQQIFVAQKGQYADRFAKAAAMLADESLPVREAGIFALRELAMADPKRHYFPVQDLLCSFMRDAARQAEEQEKENEPSALTLVPHHKPEVDDPNPCTSDVIAALRAFSDLRTPKNKVREHYRDWVPDLQKVRLINFPGHSREIDLSNANLIRAQFQGAWLRRADLRKTLLHEANLQGANLQGTRFQEAELQEAVLQRKELREAKLQRTIFSPPIWPEHEWPEGLVPSEVKEEEGAFGKTFEYFRFIQAGENRET
nr:pentapeptide repeat-containing protein [uncultured Cohaesibacter sp.]